MTHPPSVFLNLKWMLCSDDVGLPPEMIVVVSLQGQSALLPDMVSEDDAQLSDIFALRLLLKKF